MANYLIVGSSSSIGSKLIEYLSHQKSNVVALSQRQYNLAVPSFSCDLRDEKSIIRTISEITEVHGRFDSIVFCPRYRNYGELDNYVLKDELNVNAFSLSIFLTAHETLFKSDGYRSVVAVSSLSSKFPSLKTPLEYQTSKAALDTICRYYARKLGPLGIRVNIISPFFFSKESPQEDIAKDPEWLDFMANQIPLRRVCNLDEVVLPIIFLSSPASSYISGVNLTIDGGSSIVVYP
jgi:NAD(P)-dependent dehydrogenase (short-subunit alcohol dehydrogenase family)